MLVPTDLALVQNFVSAVTAASNQITPEELNRVNQAMQCLVSNAINDTIAAQAAENAELRGRIVTLEEYINGRFDTINQRIDANEGFRDAQDVFIGAHVEHTAFINEMQKDEIRSLTEELKTVTQCISKLVRDLTFLTKVVNKHRHKIPSGETTGSHEELKATTKRKT